MTADRLISIKYPLIHRAVMTRKKIIVLLMSIWLLVLCLFVSQAIIFHAFNDKGRTELTVRSRTFSLLFFTALVVLLVSNAYIFMIMKKRITNPNCMRLTRIANSEEGVVNIPSNCIRSSKVSIDSSTSSFLDIILHKKGFSAGPLTVDTQGTEQKNTVVHYLSTKASITCICLTILFIVCWFPLALFYLIWTSTGKLLAGRSLLVFCLSLASANSFLDPIVYLFRKKNFRECLIGMFKRGEATVPGNN